MTGPLEAVINGRSRLDWSFVPEYRLTDVEDRGGLGEANEGKNSGRTIVLAKHAACHFRRMKSVNESYL
jgi:hypothetical protein